MAQGRAGGPLSVERMKGPARRGGEATRGTTVFLAVVLGLLVSGPVLGQEPTPSDAAPTAGLRVFLDCDDGSDLDCDDTCDFGRFASPRRTSAREAAVRSHLVGHHDAAHLAQALGRGSRRYISDAGVVSISPVSSSVFNPESAIGHPP